MFALAGYEVVGMDVCADMIDIARKNCGVERHILRPDYEESIDCGSFDCAVIMTRCTMPSRASANPYGVRCAEAGGMFLTAEPGEGHATRRQPCARPLGGVHREDMPFSHQRELMLAAGFTDVGNTSA